MLNILIPIKIKTEKWKFDDNCDNTSCTKGTSQSVTLEEGAVSRTNSNIEIMNKNTFKIKLKDTNEEPIIKLLTNSNNISLYIPNAIDIYYKDTKRRNNKKIKTNTN